MKSLNKWGLIGGFWNPYWVAVRRGKSGLSIRNVIYLSIYLYRLSLILRDSYDLKFQTSPSTWASLGSSTTQVSVIYSDQVLTVILIL